ncbi:MAG: UDP-3-O-(3-hydroxymyristoyl)glucosamine N-acyltransferase [candidate division KSB1 bacterium]|nr:UDP-3-O-(3-hydroxymyristoyl)glucosamine N-acyltransferase [candidate division KSB1 bacterium]
MHLKISDIAEWTGAQIDGDPDLEIKGLAKIEEAEPGQLSFIANPKYAKYISSTRASAVIVDPDFNDAPVTLLRVKNPYFAFLTLAQKLYQPPEQLASGIHEKAVIGRDVQLGENVRIGPNAVIGDRCRIGDNTRIHPGAALGTDVSVGDDTVLYANVSVREQCVIGSRCIIHMGAVIGSDGFGFAFQDGKYHKLPQMGNVIIRDDVEIGANTTIDRATMGSTLIKNGVKLDNLIQVAHNVEIDEHTAIAAQTGISGSTKLGKYNMIGGQVGFAGHIKTGDRVTIGAQSGITHSVPDDSYYNGTPARPFFREKREFASLLRLPELLKRVKALEKKIKE